MSDPVRQELRLDVVAERARIKGLTDARTELAKINGYLDAIRGKLSGLGDTGLPALNAGQVAAELKKLEVAQGKIRDLEEAGRRLGLVNRKNLDEFRKFAAEWRRTAEGMKDFTGGTARSAPAVARGLAGTFDLMRQSRADLQREVLRNLFGAGGAPAQPTAAQVGQVARVNAQLTATGDIDLWIDPKRVKAHLLPGDVTGAAGAAGGRDAKGRFTGGGGEGRRRRRSAGGPLVEAAEVAASAEEISRRVVRTAERATTTVRELTREGRRQATQYDQEGQVTRTTTEGRTGLTTRQKLARQLAADLAGAENQLAGELGRGQTGDLRARAGYETRRAAAIEAALGDHRQALTAEKELAALAGLEKDAATAKRRARNLTVRAERAEASADLAGQRQLDRLLQGHHARRREVAGFLESLAQGEQRQGQLRLTQWQQAQFIADLEAQGFVRSHRGSDRTEYDEQGNRRQRRFAYEGTSRETGERERFTFTESYRNGRLRSTGLDRTPLGPEATREAGRGFLENTAHVTRWAASVGTLYTALGLATYSLRTFLELSYETARLGVVYRGVGGSVQALTADVLGLAAAQGRSSQEALQAATAWARLGLDRARINEAVRVSLMAANVAEVDTLEAAKNLQSIMAGLGLEVKDLARFLASANNISNEWNVTNKDLLEGIARVGAVARQARLPLEELQGLLGAGVGATGLPGANLGNAVKALIVSLSNPALQRSLRTGYQIEATDGAGDLKAMGDLVADLVSRYKELNKLEGQALLFEVAGKHQASKIAALFDGYIRGLVLATNSVLNLNSAEAENAKITQTLKAELAGLVTEWDKFVLLQAGNGPGAALEGAAGALRNLLALFNTPGVENGVTLVAGLLTVLAARLVVTKVAADKLAGSDSFSARTFNNLAAGARSFSGHLAAISGNFSQATAKADRFFSTLGQGTLGAARRRLTPNLPSGDPRRATGSFPAFDPARAVGEAGAGDRLAGAGLLVAGRGMQAAGTAGRVGVAGLAATAAILPELLVGIAAVTALTWGFNRGMEALGRSSTQADRILAGWNEELEKAEVRAKGAALALKTLDQAARDLPNTLDPRRRAQDIEALGDLETTGGAKLLAPERLAELRSLVEAGGTQADLRQLLAPDRQRLQQEIYNAQLDAFVESRKAQESLKREIAKLEGSPLPDRALIQQKKLELDQLRYRRGQQYQELTDGEAAEAVATAEQKRLVLVERHLAVAENLAAIYEQMGSAGPVDRLNAQLAAADARLALLTARDAALQRQAAAEGGKIDHRDQIAELEAKREQLMTAAASLSRPRRDPDVGGIYAAAQDLGSAFGLMENPADLMRRAGEVDKEIERLTAARTARAGEIANERKGLRDQLEKERTARDRLADPAVRSSAELAARMADTQRLAAAEAGSLGVGDTEGERLLDKRLRLEQAIAQARRESLSVDGSRAQITDRLIRLAEMERQKEETNLQIKERGLKVRQDIEQLERTARRDFSRNFLRAGPEEMVKRLAALQAVKQGMDQTAGGFMGLGALRPFVDELTGGDRARDLRAEDRRLHGQGRTPEQAAEDARARGETLNLLSQLTGRAAEDLARMGLNSSATAGDLGVLGEAVRDTATQFQALGQAMAAALPVVQAIAGRGPGGEAGVKLNQGGGRGAGQPRPQ